MLPALCLCLKLQILDDNLQVIISFSSYNNSKGFIFTKSDSLECHFDTLALLGW